MPTTIVTTRDRIMTALAENDCAAADLMFAGAGAELAALLHEGIIGRRVGRFYARRCETGTDARHCFVFGCEAHAVKVTL